MLTYGTVVLLPKGLVDFGYDKSGWQNSFFLSAVRTESA